MTSKAKKVAPIKDFTVNAIAEDDIAKRFVVNHVPTLEVPGKDFAYCVHEDNFLLISSRTKNPSLHKWIYLINKLSMLHDYKKLGFDLTKATFAVVLDDKAFHTREVDVEATDDVLAFMVKRVFGDRGYILRKGPNTEKELADIMKKASATK